jgi:hypothetical protein
MTLFGCKSLWIKRWLLISLVVAIPGDVLAKQNKGTPSPTTVPSATPTDSQFPSAFPTSTPSVMPSSEPTKEPTTPLPTKSLSSGPTSGTTSGPTDVPTGQPTNGPTKTPTTSPVQRVTSAPTRTEVEVKVNSVRLPTLGIDLILSDTDASAPAFDELDTELTSFIEDVLATNGGVDTLDYVSLEYNVIISVFNRRRLETGLSVKVEGIAYYGGEPPSEEDLAQNLRTYFSVWGIQDLEAYLQISGFPSARIAAISIDGDIVKAVTNISSQNEGAHVQPKTTERDSVITPGIIAGLAVGSVVLILAIVFLVAQGRKVQGSSGSRQPGNKRPTAADRRDAIPLTQMSSQTRSGRDDDSDSDAFSTDMSLYTTTDESLQRPTSHSYDAKRLDRVIALGREHSDV